MFTKPYSLRATNTLKNCQKKNIAHRLLAEYPHLTDEQAQDLVPVKSCAVWLRVTLASEHEVSILAVEHVPILLKLEDDSIVPTICALWKVPTMVPLITIHDHILPKVATGMPLYVPGIMVAKMPSFQRGAVVAARTTNNAAAALVAIAQLSSAEILSRNSGTCLDMVNVYGDQLCRDRKFVQFQRPVIMPEMDHDENSVMENYKANFHVDNQKASSHTESYRANSHTDSLQASSHTDSHRDNSHTDSHRDNSLTECLRTDNAQVSPELSNAAEMNENNQIDAESNTSMDSSGTSLNQFPGYLSMTSCSSETAASAHEVSAQRRVRSASGSADKGAESTSDHPSITSPAPAPPTDMDELLKWSLLAFLKLKAKHVQLPLKTNLLYKNYLIPICQPTRQLDVKKSSYKKLSKFLEAMQELGLVELKEEEKGVWTVTSLNSAHALVTSLRPPPAPQSQPPPADTGYTPPQIFELYCITAAVSPLFPNHKRGAAVAGSSVREATLEYVRAHRLACAVKKGAVMLDPVLADMLGLTQMETIGWDALMKCVLGKMTTATELRFPSGETKLLKHKLPLITMTVANRAGNKKVTLVSNLEVYGLHLAAVARAWQALAGAACVVTRTPTASHNQLLLQGDQTYFVAKTLTEKYGIPKKYVEGADKALKKKKR